MKRYLISEASAMTGLEAHVLRYWEEELGLLIPRNELGHRYYTEEHLNILAREAVTSLTSSVSITILSLKSLEYMS